MRILAFVLGLLGVFLASEAQAQTVCPPTAVILNSIPYGRGPGNSSFNCMVPAANSILATDGSNVPSFTQALPIPVANNFLSAAHSWSALQTFGVGLATGAAGIALAENRAISFPYGSTTPGYVIRRSEVDGSLLIDDGITGQSNIILKPASAVQIGANLNVSTPIGGILYSTGLSSFRDAATAQSVGYLDSALALNVFSGSPLSPFTTSVNPTALITRTESNTLAGANLTSSALVVLASGINQNAHGANSAETTAIWARAQKDAGSNGDVTGIVGEAFSSSTQACDVSPARCGGVFGGFFAATTYTNFAATIAVETSNNNGSGVFHAYDGSGGNYIGATGFDIAYYGTVNGSTPVNGTVGIQLRGGDGVTAWDVGLGFVRFLGVGATAKASIQDDTDATNVILLNSGAHSYGIRGTGATYSVAAIAFPGFTLNGAGTITAGLWNGTVVAPAFGGTGIANNAANTLTWSGAFAATFTLTGVTGVTFPTSGTLATTAGASIPTIVQGDLLYGSAANTLSALAKNTTATRYLSNTGTSNNPAWAQVDVSNGVTGTLQAAQEPAHTGDVTNSAGSLALALANIPTGTPMAGSLLATAIVAPGTPAAGKASIYVDSTSKNLAVKNDAGAVNHGMQTRTATANNWIRSIADDGSTTISQPAFTDISGTIAAGQVSGSYTGITGVGTLTVGATGAGFTVALSTSAITGILAGVNGGSGNGFFAVTGPTTSLKTFTFPNASATVLTDNAVVTPAQGGTGIANNNLSTLTISGNFGLTFTIGAARNVTINGNPTLNDWFDQSVKTTASPSFSQITSTIATGTSPLVVTSTTQVANLNAATLGGATFASPGTIGGTVAGIGNFASIASGQQVITAPGNGDAVELRSGLSGQFIAASVGRTGSEGYYGVAGATNDFVTGTVAGDVFLRGTTNLWLAGSGTPGIKIGSTGIVNLIATIDATSTSTGTLINPGGMAVNKRVFMNGLTASAGLQTAVICQSSAGELIADSVACLASSARFKENLVPMSDSVALAEVMQLRPHTGRYKPEGMFNNSREHVWFIAEQVAEIDTRLVGYDNTGLVRSVDYTGATVLNTGAIRALKADNDNLRAANDNLVIRVQELEAKVR